MNLINSINLLILLICVQNQVLSTPDVCPVNYHNCKNTTLCIPYVKICNGINDCPQGDDEPTVHCKQNSVSNNYNNYNPGKGYIKQNADWVKTYDPEYKHKKSQTRDDNWVDGEKPYFINTGCAAGRYLCNGTLDICILSEDICDGRQDCPHNDDEDREVCERMSSNSEKQLNQPENSEALRLKTNALSRLRANPLIDRLITSSVNSKTYSGTGFMFHVDNLIIYNSDVKMFNQNSDNTN